MRIIRWTSLSLTVRRLVARHKSCYRCPICRKRVIITSATIEGLQSVEHAIKNYEKQMLQCADCFLRSLKNHTVCPGAFT